MKVCTKCKIEKELSQFSKDKYNPDGLTYRCKPCRYEDKIAYCIENPEKYQESLKKCRIKRYERDKELIKSKTKAYYRANKEKCIAYQKEYRSKYPDKIKIVSKNTESYILKLAKKRAKYAENPQPIKDRNRQYEKNNPEKVREFKKRWAIKNQDELRAKRRDYIKYRYKNDPQYRLKRNLRRRMSLYITKCGYSKNQKSHELIGTTYVNLKNHIEKQFTDGMNWNNYGEWHIDHIIPLASTKIEKEIYKLFHYTNLQPLWASDNRKKSSNIITSICILFLFIFTVKII